MANWIIQAGLPVTLLATVVVALLLLGVGRTVDRWISSDGANFAAPTAWLIIGWATASLVSVFAAVCGLALFWPAVCLGVAGIAGYLMGVPRLPLALLTFTWLIVAPLLLIARTIPPTMYDEFAQWLPNTRFLVDHGRFPDAAIRNIWSAKAAYPPAIPIIGYGVSALIGRGSEMAAKTFSVLLAASFGLTLAELIRHRFGIILAVVTGVSFATVLNPFFDPRIALTAYADAPTGFVLAFLVYAGWRALDENAVRGLGRPIAASVLMILLRESNIVLVAGVAISFGLAGRRGRTLCIAITIASIAVFLVWRGYVSSAAMPPTDRPRALADWHWDAPWLVVRSLITDRFANNLAIGGGVVLLVALVIAALASRWRTFYPLRHLLLICCTVACLWIAFLLWSYVAVFSPQEIARAASTWRYLSQLGPMLILVCFAMLAAAFPVGAEGVAAMGSAVSSRGKLAIVTCILPGLLVVATRSHWQIDLQYPMKRTIHAVAPAVAPLIGSGDLTVVHPIEAEGIAVEIDYDLHRPAGSSVPTQTLDVDHEHGLVLDATGLENGRCPRLLHRVGAGWTDATPSDLLHYCEQHNLRVD